MLTTFSGRLCWIKIRKGILPPSIFFSEHIICPAHGGHYPRQPNRAGEQEKGMVNLIGTRPGIPGTTGITVDGAL